MHMHTFLIEKTGLHNPKDQTHINKRTQIIEKNSNYQYYFPYNSSYDYYFGIKIIPFDSTF